MNADYRQTSIGEADIYTVLCLAKRSTELNVVLNITHQALAMCLNLKN